MGPVRLFTPYKRKKRPKVKREHSTLGESDVDNINQNSNHSQSKESWQQLAEGLDTSTDYHLLENPEPTPDPHTGNILIVKLLIKLLFYMVTIMAFWLVMRKSVNFKYTSYA